MTASALAAVAVSVAPNPVYFDMCRDDVCTEELPFGCGCSTGAAPATSSVITATSVAAVRNVRFTDETFGLPLEEARAISSWPHGLLEVYAAAYRRAAAYR